MDLESFIQRLQASGVQTRVETAPGGKHLTFSADGIPTARDGGPSTDQVSGATTRAAGTNAASVSNVPLSIKWLGAPSDVAAEAVVRWVQTSLERDFWRQQATSDVLCGLPNRRGWEERLNTPPRGPFGIAVLDLDHFKDWNTRGGHLVGDQLLRLFAAHLRQAAEPCDFAARIGGDEFSFVTCDPDFNRFNRLVELIRRTWACAPALADQSGRLLGPSSVSIGAGWRDAAATGSDWHPLYIAADAALRASKAGGRNRLTITRI